MTETTLIAGSDTSGKLTRQQLALVETPPSTLTHQVIPHAEIVDALEEQLGLFAMLLGRLPRAIVAG